MPEGNARRKSRLRTWMWLAAGFILGTGLLITLLVGGCALLAGVGLVGAEAVLKASGEDTGAQSRIESGKRLEVEKALDADPKNWVAASAEPMQYKNMEVKVLAVTVEDAGTLSRRRALAVKISTRNLSASEVLRYQYWSNQLTTLENDEGDKRQAQHRGALSLKGDDVPPGGSRTEVLLFDEMEPKEPGTGTGELRLKLSLHHYEGEGHLRAKIPASMIKKP